MGMPSYPSEVLEDIRAGNDLVEVVSQYVPLKRKGDNYFGLCPFHKESSPSFSVKASEQFYHCFGCGAGGNVYGFIMRIENFSFVEAVKFLADRIRYTLPEASYSQDYQRAAEEKNAVYEIHTKAARFYYDKLNSKDGSAAAQYLDERGVSAGARRKFGLGWAGGGWAELFTFLSEQGYDNGILLKSGLVLQGKNGGYYDRFRSRLMFPIFDVQNKTVGFGGRIMGDGQPKYLNSPDTPIFNKSRNLYGINFARLAKTDEVIIVEGYMDVISLYQSGFKNVVAALGTAFNTEHVKALKSCRFKSAVLLFDSDAAGEKAALRAGPVLADGGLGVKVMQLKGAKDPDEYLQNFGRERFAEAAANAESFVSFQVNCARKRYDIARTEDKVLFVKEAAGVIAKLDNAAERDVYIKDVAKTADISEDAIREDVSKLTDKTILNMPVYKNKSNVVSTTKGVDEAKRNVLYVMATNSGLAEKITVHLVADEFGDAVYIKLYETLSEMRKSKTPIYPAAVANLFETVDEQRVVSTIFAVNFEYETEKELITAINHQIGLIKRAAVDFSIAGEDDMEKLQKLLEIKRNMKNLYISD